MALIALSFVVARCGAVSAHVSSFFGTAIVSLAALLLALSFIHYRANARALDRGAYGENRALTAALAATVILISLALAIYLLITDG
ncbi:MAG: hypothetical protein ACRDHP_09470 [Ktedonobacterales bacterium]